MVMALVAMFLGLTTGFSPSLSDCGELLSRAQEAYGKGDDLQQVVTSLAKYDDPADRATVSRPYVLAMRLHGIEYGAEHVLANRELVAHPFAKLGQWERQAPFHALELDVWAARTEMATMGAGGTFTTPSIAVAGATDEYMVLEECASPCPAGVLLLGCSGAAPRERTSEEGVERPSRHAKHNSQTLQHFGLSTQ